MSVPTFIHFSEALVFGLDRTDRSCGGGVLRSEGMGPKNGVEVGVGVDGWSGSRGLGV